MPSKALIDMTHDSWPTSAAGQKAATMRDALRAAALELSRQPVPAPDARLWTSCEVPRKAGSASAGSGLRPTRGGRVGLLPVLRGRRGWPWAGATAAASILLGALALTLAWQPPPRAPGPVSASAFVPVASASAWPGAARDPADMAWLVATELPRERLALLGLPFDPARAAEPVRAELLMSRAGTVLAVRVLAE